MRLATSPCDAAQIPWLGRDSLFGSTAFPVPRQNTTGMCIDIHISIHRHQYPNKYIPLSAYEYMVNTASSRIETLSLQLEHESAEIDASLPH